MEDVHPQIGDTDSIGFTSNTGGSSVTFKTGFAAYTAAHDVKAQMISRAARIWEVSEDDVEYEDGVLKHRADDQLQLTFRQLAARQVPTGGPIVGRGGVNPGGAGPAIACHIVDVEVDVDTGKVEILRYTAIQDAGKAIHPSYVEGADPGRSRPGNRLGAQRGVLHQRSGPHGKFQLPGLPDAHQPGPAHDRHLHR